MADNSTPDARDTARKRQAPTIDLTATEVPPATTSAAPDADSPSEPPPQEPPADAPAGAQAEPPPDRPAETRARSPIAAALAAGVAGGVIVAAIGGGLWYGGVIPSQPAATQPDTQTQQQIAGLQQQIAALKNRPAPAPAVDAKSVDALAQRVARLETSLQNLPKSGGADPQLAQKLTELQNAVAPLTQRLASAESAIKAGDTAISALNKRIDDIAANAAQARQSADSADKSVTQLQSDMKDLARNQSSSVTPAQIDALQQKLARLEQADQSARGTITQTANATSAIRLALAAQALRNAVVSGAPYRAELAQAKALGVHADRLAPLAPFADSGLPGAAALAQQLHALLPQMQKIAAPRAQVSGTFFERLQANAGRLVHISPVDAPAGDRPADVLARVEVAAAHNDVATAASDIGKLPEAAQAPAQDWLKRVQARRQALTAANALAADTARALAPGAQ